MDKKNELLFKEKGNMKKLIILVALVCLAVSTNSFASDYMNRDQRQATFCGKTFNGENVKNGMTFKVYLDTECKTSTIHFLTGKKTGEIHERKVVESYPNGEQCLNWKSGNQVCNKMKDMGDGTYQGTKTSGKWKGQHYVTLSNIVDGNQL